ncbi:hypothetical protein ACFHWD_03055 [Clostridium sp. MT-14]|uniref:hypothetical protein n=1 Tax=Clostridium sp. MT-14 TaxID=3348360 RepID=UPI0035F416F4
MMCEVLKDKGYEQGIINKNFIKDFVNGQIAVQCKNEEETTKFMEYLNICDIVDVDTLNIEQIFKRYNINNFGEDIFVAHTFDRYIGFFNKASLEDEILDYKIIQYDDIISRIN